MAKIENRYADEYVGTNNASLYWTQANFLSRSALADYEKRFGYQAKHHFTLRKSIFC